MKEDQEKYNTRLGIDYDINGIDPNFVESFAKIYRVVGLVIVTVFVIWGLSYEWSHTGRSPFESLARVFGAGYSSMGFYSLLIGVAIFSFGYYFRFSVGTLSYALIVKSWVFFMSIFRKI